MRSKSSLRARLQSPQILVLPGAADALTARIVEECGFDAVYVTGAGIANALLGAPDVGLVTLTEAVEQVRRIANAVSLPILADADTGFGGVHNVQRTVREFEQAGASGIHLEDQVMPKRCGHFDGKEVVSPTEMLQRLHAALDARRSEEFLIVARTDALAVEGYDAAVERALMYAEAGADAIFVEAPRELHQLQQLPKLISKPLIANMVEGGKTPLLSANELEQMGYRAVIFANAALRAAMKAVRSVLTTLHETGTTQSILDQIATWEERQRLVDLAGFQELERRYVALEAASIQRTSRNRTDTTDNQANGGTK